MFLPTSKPESSVWRMRLEEQMLDCKPSYWLLYNAVNYALFTAQMCIRDSIPAIRRLKWRLLVSGKVLVGGVSNANAQLTPATDQLGQPVLGFQSLGGAPYAEVGYGIDNIFKVLRIDAIHRLTYRDSPDAINFGIKISSGLSF